MKFSSAFLLAIVGSHQSMVRKLVHFLVLLEQKN
jgi:hypothetical protein